MTTPDLDLSIVIPVYNERDNLVPLEEKLETELAKLNLSYEIILIDDGSVDGSHHIIDSLKKSNPRLKLIRFGHNHGQSAAFAAGFKAARGKIFVTLDADMQNNPADIPLLLEEIKNFDVVCGWRFKRNDPWIKHFFKNWQWREKPIESGRNSRHRMFFKSIPSRMFRQCKTI